jgi:uncharacterized protein YcfL
VALAGGLGCGASKPRPANYDSTLDEGTVVMLDMKVTTQLACQKDWGESKNGLLEGHMILRNLGGRTLHVEIRTYFKDENGGNIDNNTDVWDSVTISPHEDLHYKRLATSTQAKQYQFHVRLGKEQHG